MYGKIGHTAQSYFSLRDLLMGKGGSPLAMSAQFSLQESQDFSCSWILDTSANHYVTSNAGQLSSSVSFLRSKGIFLGNGEKLYISCVGFSSLSFLVLYMFLMHVL